MALKTTRTVTLKDKEGHMIVVDENEPAQTETTLTVTCDSQRCGSRHKQTNPQVVTWVQEVVGDDPQNMPDDFARVIRVIVDPYAPKDLTFCSANCLRDYFQYEYLAPRSPREIANEMVNNMEVEKKKQKQAAITVLDRKR